MNQKNIDIPTVNGFGDEWTRFDQSNLKEYDAEFIYKSYFSIFPWDILPQNPIGFDLGCGSGRWAKFVAPRVEKLFCIDPSNAINVAKKNLTPYKNCIFYQASVDDMPIDNNSMDFGYSLGVLHHIPDTQKALNECVSKLKRGAPFLVYLYYAFDNRPIWFRFIWKITNIFRKVISKLPYTLRYGITQFIAIFIYWPLSRLALLLEKFSIPINHFPLSSYRKLGFYVMRTDALDRFGTQLEQRFTKKEIEDMMKKSGLENIIFNTVEPYWCAVGTKR